MKRECESCIKNKTIYCPNSYECLSKEDKPFYEDKYTILTKAEALDETLKDYIEEIERLIKENQKYKEVIDKAIEILKLCNSQCAKETINILNEVSE